MAVKSPQLYVRDIKSVLLSENQIRTRIIELAEAIAYYYRNKLNNDDLILLIVLKGAVMFAIDLARAIPLPIQLEFMTLSSYKESTSFSGKVKLIKDFSKDINARHVLIMEDIIDSGQTLLWLLNNLANYHPKSLQVCTLLRKPKAMKHQLQIAYIGFDIPNEFVVGYGLDFAERYRNLPYIGTLYPEMYKRS